MSTPLIRAQKVTGGRDETNPVHPHIIPPRRGADSGGDSTNLRRNTRVDNGGVAQLVEPVV